ncbi:hypothetical protein GCM10010429_35180 [Micromonospora olivasterospora]|uniref:Uncharacterized protein n=1 Tax=Micromonospora olivasterospora TaxID=1880 RepID=A0A562I7M4_MICOL|nr:hypothetical protein JD77_01981 [Micromonospora olivasterospora]
MAVATSLAAAALVAALLSWRPSSMVSVVLALLCVLLAMIAGVAATDVRQRREEGRSGADSEPAQWPGRPASGGVDADTLEALDSRDALRAVEERRRASGLSDR